MVNRLRSQHSGAIPCGSAGVPQRPDFKAWRGALAGRENGGDMSEVSGLMKGKRGVILGVANNRSIAWGIAKACQAQGAEIALTFQGDALKKRVEPLAAELGAEL